MTNDGKETVISAMGNVLHEMNIPYIIVAVTDNYHTYATTGGGVTRDDLAALCGIFNDTVQEVKKSIQNAGQGGNEED